MTREVDERKKRAALRKLRKAAMLAEKGLGPPLSDWEREFLEEVEDRIEKFGSAFADPMKGAEGEALSSLQQAKLREIDKKARGKPSRGLQTRKPMGMKRKPVPRARDHDVEADEPEIAPEPPAKPKPTLVPASSLSPPEPGKITRLRQTKPRLTVIEGGAKKTEN
ncbi:hypothetical protein HPO_10220 [Hyphomonas polymorpha PS728]|uniref:Uncharacterized protein n=1 Tax=Hyphomonas polymorpha PS728 TaxID=1280954 RepID=A0A062V8R3_9PROT|nr:hypothetical protein [Hyphomonas polymorpha]KCZ98581.1 hypothetical protein HPO_10220 [Hyphomonas polymorpha PS728]